MAFSSGTPAPFAVLGPQLVKGSDLNAALAAQATSYMYNATATGNNLATALPNNMGVTQFSTVANGTGTVLNPKLGLSCCQRIYNNGANALTVYAPAGYTIDGGASVQLSAAARCEYFCIAPGIIVSNLLGATSA